MKRSIAAVVLVSLQILFWPVRSVAHAAAGGAGGLNREATPHSSATTAQNWSQRSTVPLKGRVQQNLILAPCPAGIDYSSGAGYQVYIDDAQPEAVSVTSGSQGSSQCSITLTPYFSHSSYAIGSASSGLQETINASCGTNSVYYKNRGCSITIPTNPSNQALNVYDVHGAVFFHSNNSILNGYGVFLNCSGRGPCLQLGDLTRSTHYGNNAVVGLNFLSTNYSSVPAYAGVSVTKTERKSGIVTITTAIPHGFRPGDMVTTLFTDNKAYWGDAVVMDVPTNTTFTCEHAGSDIAPQLTPGVVALAYSAILDNSENTHFSDITNNGGWFNNFFDLWDDENATIDHFKSAGADLNHGAHWSGSFVFSAGNQGPRQQIAPVISFLNSTITSSANGVTVYNSNGLYIENTVIQGTSLWQVHTSNETGNYQGAYLKNIYSESSIASNPTAPANSPFPGLGIAGLIVGGGLSVEIAGNGGVLGGFQAGGKGSIPYSYFIVANDRTTDTHTSPMQILNWMSTGVDSIPVRWPRVANGSDDITYDIIRTRTPAGVGAVYPYDGGCLGGSAGACGYVVKGLSQSVACSGELVCQYEDTGSAITAAYRIKAGNYAGTLAFWPGSVVSVRNTIRVEVEQSNAVGVGLNGNPLQVANRCTSFGAASPGGYTLCLGSVTTSNNSIRNQTATIITDGPAAGGTALSKGRLNFSTSPDAALQPHHIITLIDSQPSLTRATVGYRPHASVDDTWIGTDMAPGRATLDAGQLAFGAPVSITNYIHAIGDGAADNWQERLTSYQKTFAVPVQIREGNRFTLGDGSPLSQMKIYRTTTVPERKVSAQSCSDLMEAIKGITGADHISSVNPPGPLGNISLNAYATEGAIILHFCNPGRVDASTPAGAYSFLATH